MCRASWLARGGPQTTTDMAAEMRKSCKVVRGEKREEDDRTAVVTGTRRRPLYCCWTTMRTLSHFPEDCGRKLVTFVSKFCYVSRHSFFFFLNAINCV